MNNADSTFAHTDCGRLWAVLPTAGSGSRFSTEKLKQYQKIGSQTVLQHSVAALAGLDLSGCMIAVAADDTVARHLSYVMQVAFCNGGATRAHSVLAGLHALTEAEDNDYVLVHDAARPCLHAEQIEQIKAFCQTAAAAAIVAVPVRDTLKYSANGHHIERTVEREQLWQAQTPQIARFGLLKSALEYAIAQNLMITDEASALQLLDISVQLLAGRGDNIKITYPEDLELAHHILQARTGAPK